MFAKRFGSGLAWAFVIVLGVAYLAFAIQAGYGPVDYETFMDIGRHWRDGEAVWVGASHYPVGMVLIFAAFSALPRWLSLTLWLGLPALLGLVLVGPWGLAFGPMLAHFVGGQAAGVTMFGIWGWRRWNRAWIGGALLALTTLKPQLAVVPVAWAAWEWVKLGKLEVTDYYMDGRKVTHLMRWRIPAPAWGFISGMTLLWVLPTLIWPWWVLEWLGNLRTLTPRAMAGALPRSMAWLGPEAWFWPVVIVATVAGLAWLLRRPSLERAMGLWVVIAPWVHDYDLIVLLPMLAKRPGWMRWVGLASLGIYVTMIGFYADDAAWWTATLPGLAFLACVALENYQHNSRNPE